jgi:hypothetical protein
MVPKSAELLVVISGDTRVWRKLITTLLQVRAKPLGAATALDVAYASHTQARNVAPNILETASPKR